MIAVIDNALMIAGARYLLDWDVLSWLLAQDLDAEQTERRQTWLGELHAARRSVLLPATGLADAMLGLGKGADASLRALRARCSVEIVSFDERAIRELLRLTQQFASRGDRRWDGLSREQRHLLALARMRQAVLIGSDDGLASAADGAGVSFVHREALAPRSLWPQMSLPLDHGVAAAPKPLPFPSLDLKVFQDIAQAFDSFDLSAAPNEDSDAELGPIDPDSAGPPLL